ncbi:MAG: hypothetical protein MZV70_41310 [Desulfobacterales bacterium]|nr:hypothetical protein [Desulfobacterales bacterium]
MRKGGWPLRFPGPRRAAKKLLRKQNVLQNESAGLEQRIQKLTESTIARTTQILTLQTALQRRMSEAGFADEAAYLRARLPQDRFDELSRLADTLQHNEVELRTRRQDRATALTQELAKKLSEKTLEQLREENATITAQLHDLQKAVGALEQLLRQHAGQQAASAGSIAGRGSAEKGVCPLGATACF